ncbi:MAG: hypothetical protein IPO64_13095 [Bacteroidetes bacterium]|jgi:hypothetical protein|nr:hypothetical protein [Bacteroidota bacterium]
MSELSLFTDEEIKKYPSSQKEAIIYFIAHLDIEMVSAFLDDNKTYQDFPKYLFISKLIDVFESFKKSGSSRLSIYKGACDTCNKGCEGATFIDKFGSYFDLIFEMENEVVLDIYQCESFCNYQQGIHKIKKIMLDIEDELDFPFF